MFACSNCFGFIPYGVATRHLRNYATAEQAASDDLVDFRPTVLLNMGPQVQIHAFSHGLCAKSGDGRVVNGGDSTGTCPWWGGLMLAAWIAHEPSDMFHGCKVVELGCGSAAMPSVAASMRGATRILATDGYPLNVSAAQSVFACSGALCSTQCFAWQDGVSNMDAGSWDVVLFADVLYKEETAALLAGTIAPLLRPGGVVIGTVGLRRPGSAGIFLEMQDQGFIAQEAPMCEAALASAQDASQRLLAIHERAPEGTMGSMAGSANECKVVRWVKPCQFEQIKHDMTENLYQQVLHPPPREQAQVCSRWVSSE